MCALVGLMTPFLHVVDPMDLDCGGQDPDGASDVGTYTSRGFPATLSPGQLLQGGHT